MVAMASMKRVANPCSSASGTIAQDAVRSIITLSQDQDRARLPVWSRDRDARTYPRPPARRNEYERLRERVEEVHADSLTQTLTHFLGVC